MWKPNVLFTCKSKTNNGNFFGNTLNNGNFGGGA